MELQWTPVTVRDLQTPQMQGFLVAQWQSTHLPTQETRAPTLVWEDPTCREQPSRAAQLLGPGAPAVQQASCHREKPALHRQRKESRSNKTQHGLK